MGNCFTSASKLEQALECRASLILPKVSDNIRSEAADKGHWLHYYKQHNRLSDLPEQYKDEFKKLHLKALPSVSKYKCINERVYVYDPIEDVVVREFASYEDYRTCKADLSNYIVGIIDASYVGRDPEGLQAGANKVLFVSDMKTGSFDYGLPRHSAQLQFGALALRAKIPETERMNFEYLLSYEYVRDGELPVAITNSVTKYDLDEFRSELVSLTKWYRENRDTEPLGLDLREGSHCKFCPCFNNCPAKNASFDIARGGNCDIIAEPLTSESIIKAHNRLQDLERICTQTKRVIKEYIDREGAVPIDAGHELRMVETTKTNVSPDIENSIASFICGETTRKKAFNIKFSAPLLMKILEKNVVNPKDIYERIMQSGRASGSVKDYVIKYVKSCKIQEEKKDAK